MTFSRNTSQFGNYILRDDRFDAGPSFPADTEIQRREHQDAQAKKLGGEALHAGKHVDKNRPFDAPPIRSSRLPTTPEA